MWQKLKGLVQYEPAVLAWAINGGIAALVAFVFHVTPDQTAAVTVITTALSAVYTAIMARPVSVSILTGSVATIATASAAFGLHLGTDVIATIVAVLSSVLSLYFRQNLSSVRHIRELKELTRGSDGVSTLVPQIQYRATAFPAGLTE